MTSNAALAMPLTHRRRLAVGRPQALCQAVRVPQLPIPISAREVLISTLFSTMEMVPTAFAAQMARLKHASRRVVGPAKPGLSCRAVACNQKNPLMRVFFGPWHKAKSMGRVSQLCTRFLAHANPTKPNPIRATVPGSGTRLGLGSITRGVKTRLSTVNTPAPKSLSVLKT